MKKQKYQKESKSSLTKYLLCCLSALALALPVVADQAEFVRVSGDTMTGSLAVLDYVGIGTQDPQRMLEIQEPGNSFLRLSTQATDDYYSQIEFADQGGVEGYLRYSYYEHLLRFIVNQKERLRINSDGYIGIGTESPNYALDVQRSTSNYIARFRNTRSGNGVLIEPTGSSEYEYALSVQNDAGLELFTVRNSGQAYFQGSSGEVRLWIDNDGYVGIGTQDPQATLHVKGDIQVDGNIAAKYQ